MPSGLWMPDTTPSPVRWASRLPDRIWIGVRQIPAASSMKARPLRASRQAALALLSVMGCDMVQGFLISRPMAFDALTDFLSSDPVSLHPAPSGSAFNQPPSFWKST